MDESCVLSTLERLEDGVSEPYCHPAPYQAREGERPGVEPTSHYQAKGAS